MKAKKRRLVSIWSHKLWQRKKKLITKLSKIKKKISGKKLNKNQNINLIIKWRNFYQVFFLYVYSLPACDRWSSNTIINLIVHILEFLLIFIFCKRSSSLSESGVFELIECVYLFVCAPLNPWTGLWAHTKTIKTLNRYKKIKSML